MMMDQVVDYFMKMILYHGSRIIYKNFKMSRNKITLFLLIPILILSSESITKDFNSNYFTCADEIGPILEFSIPKFNKDQKKETSLKLFNFKDRKKFDITNGLIQKKSSPIDTSYYFYAIKSSVKNEFELEFFPPSHALFKKNDAQFTDLVCWIGEK